MCDTLTPLVGKVSAANVGPSCRRHGALVWDGQGEFLTRCSPPRLPAVSLPLLPSRCCPHRPCPHCRSRRRKGLRLPRRGARLHGHAEQEQGWLVSPPAARTGTRANRTSSCRGGLMHGGSAASKGCYPLWGGTFESMDNAAGGCEDLGMSTIHVRGLSYYYLIYSRETTEQRVRDKNRKYKSPRTTTIYCIRCG